MLITKLCDLIKDFNGVQLSLSDRTQQNIKIEPIVDNSIQSKFFPKNVRHIRIFGAIKG